MLEPRNPRGVLDQQAPLLRLRVQDLVDAPLLDRRVGLRPDVRLSEDLLHVLESRPGAVDEVLALAAPEQPPRQNDVTGRAVRRAVQSGQLEGDLRHPDRLAPLAPVEDHVLHVGAAKRPSALFAENPVESVPDVRLAAAVRADDSGDPVRERNFGAVGERLEPGDPDLLELELRHARLPSAGPLPVRRQSEVYHPRLGFLKRERNILGLTRTTPPYVVPFRFFVLAVPDQQFREIRNPGTASSAWRAGPSGKPRSSSAAWTAMRWACE